MAVDHQNIASADADKTNWVDRFAPPFSIPYLRLMRADRPIGSWLLLLPCWFGLGLAAAQGASPPWLYYGFLFAIGAFVMRGAGCAYNDIVDVDFDAKVERTAQRPIPSGQVSIQRAWIFLVGLSLVGLVVLLQFNFFTIVFCVSSLALIAAYPFMKRITWWPQLWLGLTFNWGALAGYSAATGTLNAAPLFIYLGCIFWTLGYDTIYAHQDKDDDALIGVKSTARRLGEKTKPMLVVFYGMTIALFAVSGAVSNFGLIYFLALAAPACHFIWQVRALRINDSAQCLMLFKSNRNAGFLLLAPMLLETLTKAA